MKKSFICFLAGAVAAVLVFTGCQTAEEKAVAKYKTALVKGREMESYTTAGNVDMEVGISGMNMDISISLDGSVKDKGKTAAFHMVTQAMGQTMETDMFSQDGYLYTGVPGAQGKFIKQSYEEATGMQYQQLLDMRNTEMTAIYAEAIDKAENLTCTQMEDKKVNVTFDFPQETLTSMENTMVEMLSGSMGQTMENNLREQLGVVGLSGQELDDFVKQMMSVYQEMFSSLTINKIAMNTTINKEGYAVNQKMTMEMSLDFSSLLNLLGEASDPIAQAQLKNISFKITANMNVDNINEDVSVEVPAISEENILTQEEAAAYQLAA